jgi:hypothetical protein
MSTYETLFEAPLAHESTELTSEQAFTTELGGLGEEEIAHYAPEGAPETGSYEDEDEDEDEADPFIGGLLGSLFGGSGEWSGGSLGEEELTGEADPFIGGLIGRAVSAIGSALGGGSDESWSQESATEADPFLGGLIGSLFGGSGEWSGEWSGEEEASGEADRFLPGLTSLVRRLGPVAARLAPTVVRRVAGLVPGGPAFATRILGLIRETEASAGELEAALFAPAASGETHESSVAEAILSEVLASEAALSRSPRQAVTWINATLPLTIEITASRRRLRPVVPALAQANVRLVRTLGRQQGGRQLLATVPTINRLAAQTLRRAAAHGRPITAPMAVGALGAAARRVLGNPARVAVIVGRNRMLRSRFPGVTRSLRAGGVRSQARPRPARRAATARAY